MKKKYIATFAVVGLAIMAMGGLPGLDDEGNPLTPATSIGAIDGAQTDIANLGDLIAPGYQAVSNAAVSAIDASYISPTNSEFVTAVTNCPVLVNPDDASELGEYGTYGTIGAAIMGLLAAAAALKKTKANSNALAPGWSNTSVSYQVSQYITYNGNAYECMAAYTTDAQSPTPDNDIYDDTTTPATGHWKLTDMTTPDATLDITSQGSLRVVSAGGQILWQQGYNLKTTSSVMPANEAVNKYDFAANATANVSLTLPTPPTDKVGDFVLDVTNPALDTTTFTQNAFESTATYAVGDEVIYDSKIWRCVTAVSTAGAWTGTTNWEEAWPYFSIAGLSSTLEIIVPEGENLTDILSFAPGTKCELYFTLTSFAVDSHPTWKVVRQNVEVVA